MEKVYQAVGADGLKIPMTLMRQYGLEPGSGVTLELDVDGIRIVPTRPDRVTIENRALRYLLTYVGDAATLQAIAVADGSGWQVDVYGAGRAKPAGALFYSASGELLQERSTPPAEIRRAIGNTSGRP